MFSAMAERILIIDNEQASLEALSDVLVGEGYKLSVVSDADAGLKSLDEWLPSLIILNQSVSGIDSIESFRKQKSVASVPIVVVFDESVDSALLTKAYDAGATECVALTIDPAELLSRVKMLLRCYGVAKTNLDLQTRVYEQQIAILETELEGKKQELTSSSMHLIQNNKQVDKLVAELNSIAVTVDSSVSVQIAQAVRKYKLKSTIGSWDEFDKAFLSVYLGFYDKLRELHPKLSVNDRRMCAFSKMGLTNREVCQLTNRNQAAVKKAKLRLRMKLGLEAGVLIGDYMQSI